MAIPVSASEEGGVGSCGLGEVSGERVGSPVMKGGEVSGKTENSIILYSRS